MEGRSNLSSRWPASTSVPTVTGEGPVQPTSMAISTLRPLGLSEVALSEDGDLGAWQQRNSTKTLPHCIEQVLASGALRNLQRVAEGRWRRCPARRYAFLRLRPLQDPRGGGLGRREGASDGVEQFIEEVSGTLGARSARGRLPQFVVPRSTP